MTDTASAPNPAYVFVSLEVTDPESFHVRYALPVLGSLTDIGAEVLVATGDAVAREGRDDNGWSVLLKFPSMDVFDTWYASDGYAPLKKIRREFTVVDRSLMLAMPAFEGAK